MLLTHPVQSVQPVLLSRLCPHPARAPVPHSKPSLTMPDCPPFPACGLMPHFSCPTQVLCLPCLGSDMPLPTAVSQGSPSQPAQPGSSWHGYSLPNPPQTPSPPAFLYTSSSPLLGSDALHQLLSHLPRFFALGNSAPHLMALGLNC